MGCCTHEGPVSPIAAAGTRSRPQAMAIGFATSSTFKHGLAQVDASGPGAPWASGRCSPSRLSRTIELRAGTKSVVATRGQIALDALEGGPRSAGEGIADRGRGAARQEGAAAGYYPRGRNFGQDRRERVTYGTERHGWLSPRSSAGRRYALTRRGAIARPG